MDFEIKRTNTRARVTRFTIIKACITFTLLIATIAGPPLLLSGLTHNTTKGDSGIRIPSAAVINYQVRDTLSPTKREILYRTDMAQLTATLDSTSASKGVKMYILPGLKAPTSSLYESTTQKTSLTLTASTCDSNIYVLVSLPDSIKTPTAFDILFSSKNDRSSCWTRDFVWKAFAGPWLVLFFFLTIVGIVLTWLEYKRDIMREQNSWQSLDDNDDMY
eukprot:TRINITY_DN2246_c0_g1_i1.p1 TRINITY_DN2246_c0_g1~~TRINITY_DN2246_c0_g1_i1.p1  ORF type:complete len:219 (+),score=57.79 TRINITY_DN2246_c0_g1_i1:187-843(+)